MGIMAVDTERAAELRALARREPNARTRVRLLGVANVLGGMAIAPAARAVGAGRATLYDWLGRYRREGIDGLRDRAKSGRPRLLTPAQDAAFKARIAAGPADEQDGVTAFRGVDMQRILKEEFEVKAGLSSTYPLAHRLGLAWVAPRPKHPKADPAAHRPGPPPPGRSFRRTSRRGSWRSVPVCRPARRSRSGSRTR